jgi:hydroxyacylglutathione hydrolase
MTATNAAAQEPVTITAIPAFSDNYIWMIADTKHAVVVDPGQAQPVLDRLQRDGLTLTAILLTHHHHDHVGGVQAILDQFAVPVYGPALEVLPACDFPLVQDDRITLDAPALALSVIDVPGHTAGHIALTGTLTTPAGAQSVLFCGDTLFVGGCGRLFEGTPAQMLHSLDQLAALPSNTQVFCAHEYTLANLRWARTVEPHNQALSAFEATCIGKRDNAQPTVPSTIEIERQCNPFLRSREPVVVQAAQAWSQQTLTAPVDVFAALREWKNGFK